MMDVIFRGEIVDRVKVGEKCIFIGVLIVVLDVSQFGFLGFRKMVVRDDRGVDVGGSGVGGLKVFGVRDLIYRLVFLVCMVMLDVFFFGVFGEVQIVDMIGSLNGNVVVEMVDSLKEMQDVMLSFYIQVEVDDFCVMVYSDYIYFRLVQLIVLMVYGYEIVKKGIFL